MPRYIFHAECNATDGQEDEFNRWYDGQHAPDVLKVEGFLSCQRYRIAPEDADSPAIRNRYLAIYEVEAESVAAAKAAMAAVGAAGGMPLSPSIDLSNASFHYYEVFGEKVLAR